MSALVNWIGGRAPIEKYRSWNREERHMAATLYAMMLTDKAGLHRLLADVCQLPCTREAADAARIWFEFAFLRDWWWQLKTQNVTQSSQQEALCKLLEIVPVASDTFPAGIHQCAATLKELAPRDFNRLFSARPSDNEVESPARWSERVIAERRAPLSPEMARRAVLLAWSFRIKPDLVVTFGQQHAVIIEAKWDSRQSQYTCQKLRLKSQQIQLQTDMFTQILGFSPARVHPLLLAKEKGRRAQSASLKTLGWPEAFGCFRAPSSLLAKSVLPDEALDR
jgi:hypothetical protein